LIRSNYSNPPIHGAKIAGKIFSVPEYRSQWLKELKTVTERMNNMRAVLKEALIKNGTKGNWDHVTTQIGMFSFTGLNAK